MKKVIQNLLLISFMMMGHLYAQTLADGVKMMENENYTQAQNIFEMLAKKEPTNPLPHYQLGQLKYILEDYKGAFDAYNAGLKVSTKCTECNIGLAKLMLDNGKNLEADKALESIAKSNKKNAVILALVGDAYLYNKKPNAVKAIDYLTRSRDVDPKSATTYAHLGDAYNLSGDLGRAMSSYENAVEKDKTNLEAYMSMARIWKSSRQTDLAIEMLEKAIKLNDSYAPAYKDLYELYITTKQYTIMLPILDKYISLSGDDLKAKVRLVKFLCYQAKDYDRAIKEGEKLVISNPEEYTLYRWLAWSYAETENWQESYDNSVKLFKALEQDTSRQSFQSDYEYYAKAALKLSKLEEADSLFVLVMEIDTTPGKDEEIYGTLAKAYYDKKDCEKALEFLKKKEALKPLTVAELANIASCHYRSKRFTEADSVYTKVVELSPTYIYGYFMIAKSKDAMEVDPANKVGLAKDAYLKFVEVASADTIKNKDNLIKAYDYLGTLAASLEPIDKEGAIAYFELILTLDPTDERAISILDILKKS